MNTTNRFVISVVSLLALAALVYFLAPSSITYALCIRDIEFNFLVNDADTGDPIPNATVKIRIDTCSKIRDERWQRLELVTDATGRAKLLRKDASCEDVIRPLRKTVTLVDRTWCVFSIDAPAHKSTKEAWLADVPYEDFGYFKGEALQRIEFRLKLQSK
jgi:hypothetical protein